jgi:hypothetical protein
MSGELCALWIGLVSLATACAVRLCLPLAGFAAVEGATPSWFFLSDDSPLNFEVLAASRHGAHAALFQLGVRWESPDSGRGWRSARLAHSSFNSRSFARPALAERAAVENS